MSEPGVVVPQAVPLSFEDAQILALESGAIRGHTLKILLLQEAPGPSVVPELRAHIGARLAGAPRWQQRLVPAPGTPAGLAWQYDPGFRIDRHVRVARTDGPVDEGALRQLVARTMATALDRSMPLWTLDVIPEMADGRWALIWKVHHCLADGVTILRAGSRLLWTQPTGASVPDTTRRLAPRVPGQVRAGTRLAMVAGSRGLMIREFRRMGPLSPLATATGPDRAVAFTRCALGELRTIGKALTPPATINDVLLAAVAGALRHWLIERGASPAAMKVQVPVSMHPDPGTGEPQGNRDSFLLMRLPISEADAVARLRAVTGATRRRKNRHDAQAIYALRRTIAHLPQPLRRPVQRVVQGPHEYSLNVSNVPGPASPIEVLGHQADEMYTLAEIAPRHALRISAVSLAGSFFIGLCADPTAIPDLEVIATGFSLSVSELHDRLLSPV